MEENQEMKINYIGLLFIKEPFLALQETSFTISNFMFVDPQQEWKSSRKSTQEEFTGYRMKNEEDLQP